MTKVPAKYCEGWKAIIHAKILRNRMNLCTRPGLVLMATLATVWPKPSIFRLGLSSCDVMKSIVYKVQDPPAPQRLLDDVQGVAI
jgi:hypothetical protein